MNPTRTRNQQGSLTTEKRKIGPAVWVYRWRETNAAGARIKRKVVVGSKASFPSKTAALKQVATLGLDINDSSPTPVTTRTVAELIEHYRQNELTANNGKTALTIAVYEGQIRRYILPKWGAFDVGQVKAVAVEAWLKSLTFAPATKAKIRNIMSTIFQHARRHEWMATNPISLVRQGSMRLTDPDILTAEEVSGIFEELEEPHRTIVHVAAVTGMRRGEVFGLKWGDVDFEESLLRVLRSIVDQTVGETKTKGSRRPLPLSEDVLAALRVWKGMSRYAKDEDWVFASPQALGSRPYWPNTVLVRHVKPAAVRAGITKHIGWHTFRHTLATLLHSSGATVKVAQDLLRHASPVMTMGTYAQAVTEEKRDAQAVVAAMFTKPVQGSKAA